MTEGQVYFNSSSTNAFKVSQYNIPGGSWASAATGNTARGNSGSFGAQTAAIIATGYDGTNVSNVESYNGSAWSEVNEVNSPRRELSGFGTSTAGLIMGGRPPATGATESWNGSTWTEVNDLNTARADTNIRAGTQTDGIYAGVNHQLWLTLKNGMELLGQK